MLSRTKRTPTQEGCFWFYGNPYEYGDLNPSHLRLCLVEIKLLPSRSYLYWYDSCELYNTIGYWQEILQPQLPEVE